MRLARSRPHSRADEGQAHRPALRRREVSGQAQLHRLLGVEDAEVGLPALANRVHELVHLALEAVGCGSAADALRPFGASDERFHVRGGNQQVPLAIGAALPSGTVATSHRLTAVAANRDGTVSLTFTDPNNGTLSYTVGGVSATKSITRQLF